MIDEITTRLIRGEQGPWNLYVYQETDCDIQRLEQQLTTQLGTPGQVVFSIVENTNMPYPIPKRTLYLVLLVMLV